MPPIKDPITEPTIIPVLLDDDCDRGDEGYDGGVGDLGLDDEGVDDKGTGGTKDVTQIYSSLLLISSNNISLSTPCVYPLPIKKIFSKFK